MIVKHVTFNIKSEFIDKFIEATLENQKYSIKEKGIIGFEFYKTADDSSKFILFEKYDSEDSMEEHLKTEHFKKWINTVENMFLSPRERSIYIPIIK